MKINELLKQYRTVAGFTQEETAKRLFVDRTTYTGYETGKRKMDAETLFSILDIFGVEISLKEKQQYEWTLSFQKENTENKMPVIISLYEENGEYDIDVYESKNGDMIASGSWNVRQGTRFDLDSIKWIIEDEFEHKYHIENIMYETVADIQPFLSTSSRSYTMSISLIRRMVQKMLFDSFQIESVPHVEFEHGDLGINFDNEEEVEEALMDSFVASGREEDDFYYLFSEFFLEQVFQKNIRTITKDENYDDVLYIYFK